jgi:hypothetical protein
MLTVSKDNHKSLEKLYFFGSLSSLIMNIIIDVTIILIMIEKSIQELTDNIFNIKVKCN